MEGVLLLYFDMGIFFVSSYSGSRVGYSLLS